MNLAAKLQHYRKQSNLTQQQAADAVHLSVKTISAYETGKNEPNLEIIRKLAELYHITPSQLVDVRRAERTPHLIPIVIHPDSYDELLKEVQTQLWEKNEPFNFRGTTIQKEGDVYVVKHDDSEFYHSFMDGALNVALAMHEVRTGFF